MKPLKRALRRALHALSLKAGLITERPAPLPAVQRFLETLWPVETGMPLVRAGRERDGGYLVPDDMNGLAGVVSPGVSTEIGFDEAMAARGLPVFMCDASVDGPPAPNPLFTFEKKFLDLWEDEGNTTLDSFVTRHSSAGDLLLQMDIEGAEYRVLTSASEDTLKRFRIMIIEFHGLDAVFGREGLGRIESLFRKLAMTHAIAHIHPNNAQMAACRGGIAVPPLLEITFLRRDRLKPPAGGPARLPHPLDVENVPYHAAVPVPQSWRPKP